MIDQDHDRIPAGYVRRAHGIGGDVVVRGTLTDADARFVVGAVFVTNEERPREFTIEGVRPHQGDYIVDFGEIRDRNTADGLRGVQFTIDKSDRRDLEFGEWWPEDLMGCVAVDLDDENVGTIVGILTGAAQDRIVLERADGVRGEVPFVEALVHAVDTDAKRIVVDLPEGLFVN